MSVNMPKDEQQTSALIASLDETNSYIELEKTRVHKGIEDMERIKKHRSDYNKIGFALYLGFIRHKGWALTENTKIPRKIIDFVAKQLELDPAEFHKYNVTSSTSFSHYKEIRKAYKYKPLESKFNLELESFMYEYIFKSEDSFYLVSTFMDECRNKKILLPSILVIEDFISKLIIELTLFLKNFNKNKLFLLSNQKLFNSLKKFYYFL